MDKKEQQTNITIPLHDLIFCILGDDNNGLECAEVSKTAGIVLDNLLKGSLKWKIEWNDWDDKPLKLPILWRYKDWFTESGRQTRMRERSHAERVVYWLEQENLKRVKYVLMKKQSLSENYAQMLAWKLLKERNMEVLKFFGVTKLAECEEDLE